MNLQLLNLRSLLLREKKNANEFQARWYSGLDLDDSSHYLQIVILQK